MAGHAPAAGFFSPVIGRRRVEGLEVALLRQARARALPAHGHARAYFSFLIAGSYRERWGGRELAHQISSVVFHPPGLEHRDAYGRGGGEILHVEMESRWLAPWAAERLGRRGPFEVRGAGVLRAAWRLTRGLAHAGGEAPSPAGALAVECSVVELLCAVQPQAARRERRRPAWLQRTVERLHGEFASPPSMSALSRDGGVHPAHLSRAFRDHLGCSPTELVQRLRVEHVWRRLAADRPPALADLALEAGFSDQAHCTRVFKRLVGSPPGAFCATLNTARARQPGPTP